jgi:hypothetical protein
MPVGMFMLTEMNGTNIAEGSEVKREVAEPVAAPSCARLAENKRLQIAGRRREQNRLRHIVAHRML